MFLNSIGLKFALKSVQTYKHFFWGQYLFSSGLVLSKLVYVYFSERVQIGLDLPKLWKLFNSFLARPSSAI